jgi:hypothetical protein
VHCGTQQSTNQAICGCNSIKSDSYGSIRADEATIQRLVILRSKPKPSELDWDRKTKELIINLARVELEWDVGSNLRHHLVLEYQVFNRFTIEGCNEAEKKEPISQFETTAKSSFECRFGGLVLYDSLNQYINQPYNILLL